MPGSLIPHHPHEVGIAEASPDLAQLEGAHLLANEARALLVDCGFDDRQILEWAETYIAEYGSGDLDGFVAWIEGCEAAT